MKTPSRAPEKVAPSCHFDVWAQARRICLLEEPDHVAEAWARACEHVRVAHAAKHAPGRPPCRWRIDETGRVRRADRP